MSNKQQQRFKVAVYISIISIAIALIIAGYFIKTDDFWKNLTLNVATDLLGVGLLFFIVNKFFGLDTDENLLKRLESAIGILDRRVSVLNDREESRKKFHLAEILQTAQEIDIVGWNLASVLEEIYDPIIKRVLAGARVRIMITDPTSMARDLISQNTVIHDFDGLCQRAIKYVKIIEEQLEKSPRKVKGSFEFRVLNWIPSCHVFIVNSDHISGVAKVEVYSLHYRIPAREGGLSIVINRSDQPQWFDYFVNQFDKTWSNGTPFKHLDVKD